MHCMEFQKLSLAALKFFDMHSRPVFMKRHRESIGDALPTSGQRRGDGLGNLS